MNHLSKISSEQEIIKISKKIRSLGKRIVTYNGSFDILHPGHLRSIAEAKAQGDVLIMLINSNKSIKKYKGPNRPLFGEKFRLELISSLQDVDYVSLLNDINPKRILSQIKPDIHCNGSDWGENCIEKETVEKAGGKIHVLKWQSGYSTTNILKEIVKLYSLKTCRAVFLDRDGTVNENKSGYISKIEDFVFKPTVIAALKALSKSDFIIIIITNQSGIGRGLFSEGDFKKLNSWMLQKLKENEIRIDKVYYCPHLPDENCTCRKPKIGMLLQAVNDFGISLAQSFLIGDDERDVMMGREANIKTMKLGAKMNSKNKLEPNIYIKDLSEAVKIILKTAKV